MGVFEDTQNNSWYYANICLFESMRVGDNSIGLYIDEMEQTVDELIKKESNEEVKGKWN